MAKGVKPEKFRQDRAAELRQLEEILSRQSVSIVNPNILNAAANRCMTNKPYGPNSWGYEVDGLQFRVKRPQKTIPSSITGPNLVLNLDIEISGQCDANLKNHIEQLVLNIEVSTEDRSHLCTWHFDRHIFEEEGDEAEEAHPLYHFQHGGHGMTDIADSLGRMLLIPAPRLPFPPMDAILAIDFILSNFAGNDWKNLRLDGTYKNRISYSQERFWKPYVEQIMSWWGQGRRVNEHEITMLWPHLI